MRPAPTVVALGLLLATLLVLRPSGAAAWGAATLVATVAYGTNAWTDSSVAGSSQYRYRLDAIRTGTTWVSAPGAWSNIVNSPTLCL